LTDHASWCRGSGKAFVAGADESASLAQSFTTWQGKRLAGASASRFRGRGDLVARLGGDEVGILLDDIKDATDA